MITLSWRGDHGTPFTKDVPDTHAAGLTLGRVPTCDIVLDHPTVSRQHARLAVRDGRCLLSDLGSTQGTRVNGQPIAGETELHDGDSFSIGHVDFLFGRSAAKPLLALDDRPVLDSAQTIFRRVDTAAGPRLEGNEVSAHAEAVRLTRLLAEIGKTLVTVQPLPQVLEKVVDLTFDVVSAERAFLLLRDSAYDALTPRVVRCRDGSEPGHATLSRTVVNIVMRDRVAMLAADAQHDDRLGVAGSIHQLNIRSFICAPLWNQNEVIGVLYVDNPRSRRFSEDDLMLLVALSNYAAVAIEQARLSEHLLEETRRRERLQRYHSPGVVNRILSAGADATAFDTQERDLTVMFADIVGFTTMSERMAPADVAATLNEFFRAMTDVIFDHQGTLDKFIGDAILAVFGAPFPEPNHAENAVRAAIAMRRALSDLNLRHPDRTLNMRIAIHSGRALTGDIGSPRRREFTVLGDTVNTASRLESTVAKPGQIVISRETLDRSGGGFRTEPLGPFTLRGRQSAVEVFAVLD